MKRLAVDKIIIMPDYDSTYAWDDDGCTFYITCLGRDDMGSLHRKLSAWASYFWDIDNDPNNFPWDKYNAWGIELAQELKCRIGRDVEVIYRKNIQDITRNEWEQSTIRCMASHDS